MRKSFSLLITLFVLVLFSYLCLSMLQTKSLTNTNIKNQYLYLQANNHKEFLKLYLLSIDLKNINHIRVEDKIFDIYAKIKKVDSIFEINIFVKAKTFDISIYENIQK